MDGSQPVSQQLAPHRSTQSLELFVVVMLLGILLHLLHACLFRQSTTDAPVSTAMFSPFFTAFVEMVTRPDAASSAANTRIRVVVIPVPVIKQ